MNEKSENEEINFKVLKNKYIQTFFNDLTEGDKKRIYFNDYIWHAFTYGIIPCTEGYDAVKEFEKRNQNDVYVISMYSGIVVERKNLTYEELLRMRYMNSTYNDCFVVDKNFRWTFIFTHETLPDEDIAKQIMQNKIEGNEVPYYIGPFFKSLDNDCIEKAIDNTLNNEKFIVNKFKPDKYNELIEYCFKNSDYFSLTKYNDQYYISTENIIRYILDDKKITNDEILNDNIDELSRKLDKLYKENITIYKIKLLQQLHIFESDLKYYNKFKSRNGINYSEKNIKKIKDVLVLIQNGEFKETIDNSNWLFYTIRNYKYNKIISNFIEKTKNLIYSIEEKKGLWDDENEVYITIYKFKKCDETKKLLLQDFDNIYCWAFPDTLEDLCFYRNDEFWFSSISHEQECYIKPKDEIEEEYIKSLAIDTTDNDSDMQ